MSSEYRDLHSVIQGHGTDARICLVIIQKAEQRLKSGGVEESRNNTGSAMATS